MKTSRVAAPIHLRQFIFRWRGHLARSLLLAAFFTVPAHAQIDTNDNGMSDVWERHFNNGTLFDPHNPDHAPTADPDGDGWTNLQESVAGTDPFDASPVSGMVTTCVTQLQDQHEEPTPAYPEGRVIDLSIISWDTTPGKRYVLKASPDLSAGSWLSIDEPYHGDGLPAAASITLTDTGGESPERLFWRVQVEDPHADSDDDGLTDYEEYLLGSNPQLADTSGDGVPDGWLASHGYLPTQNHENTMFQGSDITVVAAFQMGVQSHPDATLDDFDGDGLPNSLDADPTEKLVYWERTPESTYAITDLQVSEDLIDHLGHLPAVLNNNDEVVRYPQGDPDDGNTPWYWGHSSGHAWRPLVDYLHGEQNTPYQFLDWQISFDDDSKTYLKMWSGWGQPSSYHDSVIWNGPNSAPSLYHSLPPFFKVFDSEVIARFDKKAVYHQATEFFVETDPDTGEEYATNTPISRRVTIVAAGVNIDVTVPPAEFDILPEIVGFNWFTHIPPILRSGKVLVHHPAND